MGKAKAKRLKQARKTLLHVSILPSIPSHQNQSHCVFIGIKRHNNIVNYAISDHSCIMQALTVYNRYRSTLLNFKYAEEDSDDTLMNVLVETVVNSHPDYAYQRHDGIYQKVARFLIAAYGDFYLNGASEYITLEDGFIVENPPAENKGIYCVCGKKIAEGEIPPGEKAEDHYVFSIMERVSELPFSLPSTNKIMLFSSYVSAAYITQHVNHYGAKYLTDETLKRLLWESNKLQGKI